MMQGLMLALALLIAGAAEAGAATISGAGDSSCGMWTADRPSYVVGSPATDTSARAQQEILWVIGFLSGVSVAILSRPSAPIGAGGSA